MLCILNLFEQADRISRPSDRALLKFSARSRNAGSTQSTASRFPPASPRRTIKYHGDRNPLEPVYSVFDNIIRREDEEYKKCQRCFSSQRAPSLVSKQSIKTPLYILTSGIFTAPSKLQLLNASTSRTRFTSCPSSLLNSNLIVFVASYAP